MTAERLYSKYGIDKNGITNVRKIHWNHNTPLLYEDVIKNGEGHVTHRGPIITRTGLHTGRAAKDKFIVEEEETKGHIWWGDVNKSVSPATFENMFRRLQAYLQDRDVWVQDCFAGADRDTGCRCGSSRSVPGTPFSHATCSSRQIPKN